MKILWGLQQSTEKMVHVDDVPNGKASGCVCPACRTGLVAKNQGTVKGHHFGHTSGDDQFGACEGWLHATAKRLLYERTQKSLEDDLSIPIQWQCQECSCKHDGNLLDIATTVHMKTTIPAANIRPEILIQKDERPIALVEIVHTHPPEAHVFEWAKTHKCPIMVIEVAAEDDLDHWILAPTLNLTITGGVCQREMCERCGEGRSCNKGHWVRCQVCNDQHKFRCGLQPHRFG